MKNNAFIILGSLATTMIFAVAAANGGDSKIIQPPVVGSDDSTLFPSNQFRYTVFAETANGNVDSDPGQTTTYTTTTTTTTTTPPVPKATPNPDPPTTEILKATGPGGTTTKTTRHTTRHIRTSDHLLHNAAGGGVQLSYFFNRYFGVSLEGDFLGSYDYNTAVTGNLIFRYPFEFGATSGYSKDGKSTPSGPTWGLAPYALIGGGGQWDGHSEGVGVIGGGLEFAFQHGYGVFVEGRWVIHDARQSYAAETAGLTFGF
jgi:hypothetical protein